MIDLRYGRAEHLKLDLAPESLLAVCDAPRGEPLAEVRAATDQALREPLGIPGLNLVALPGDRVVLALNAGVPQAPLVVERTLAALVSAGVTADCITLVLAEEEPLAPDPLSSWLAAGGELIASVVHDPKVREALSYLAASTDATPIYLNRAIHDADLVVSIGCLRLDDSLGYHGVNSVMYPTFSDAASLSRFRAPKAARLAEREKLRKQVDEVAWLLGARFTIQVIPAAGDGVLHVLAGDLDEVYRWGSRLCEESWRFEVPSPANLVITTIAGEHEQTWENFGRALASAALTLDEDGSVVVCCELADRPGRAVQRLAGAEDLDEALDEIIEVVPPDAMPAVQLIKALQRGKVYLASKLADDLVEELGMHPVSPKLLARVVQQFKSCVVLGNAHYGQARPPQTSTLMPSTKRRPSHS